MYAGDGRKGTQRRQTSGPPPPHAWLGGPNDALVADHEHQEPLESACEHWHGSCSFIGQLGPSQEETVQTSTLNRDRTLPLWTGGAAEQLTLLELIETVREVANDDREVVATVTHMLSSGRIKRESGAFQF